MVNDGQGELEMELEQEFEGELELEGEGELELEGEFEGEFELEGELEGEFEGEGFLGDIVGGLLEEQELEGEFEGELETEQFFGNIGNFLKNAAPILKKVAKVAAPIVGGAILGPAGAALGKAAGAALGEGELEGEFEGEFEGEGEQEMEQEIATHPLTLNEVEAEMMAAAASQEPREGEAEAMAGAAAVTVISPRDRRALRRILPYLVRGTAILTRILRKRRATRPAVRAVPTIMRRTVKSLKRHAAKGGRITRHTAARAATKQVRRVLGSPKALTAAVGRNVKVSRKYNGPQRLRRRRVTVGW